MKKKLPLFFIICIISGLMAFLAFGAGVFAEDVIPEVPSESGEQEEPAAAENPFIDVPEGKWFTDGVLYCYRNGYMTGMTKDTFAPSGQTTRAQFVTILAKVAGADLESYTPDVEGLPFTDVKAGWYSKPLKWAYENGFTTGTSATTFTPNGRVTREQVATFLYTFASKTGRDVAFDADLNYFRADADKVANYARKAITWAVDVGLISGTADETLSPKGNCTRAQIALMIKKFVEYYSSECEHVWSDPSCTKGRVCTVCGYTRGTPLGHTSYATCTEDSAPCERCERVEKALGHNAAPTCTKGATCTRCGTEFKALGHDIKTKANCTRTSSACTRCGYVQPALGHNIETPATCTAASSKCTRCGYVQPALGHTTENGKCGRCGKEIFNDNFKKLKYYIQKNGRSGKDGDGDYYKIASLSDVSVNGADVTVYPYLMTYTNGDYKNKIIFGAYWYYGNDDGLETRIIIPSFTNSYKFITSYYDHAEDDIFDIGVGTLKPGSFNKSYKLKFTDTILKQEYVSEYQSETVALIDAGIRAVKNVLSVAEYKNLLGGVTFKNMGFTNY